MFEKKKIGGRGTQSYIKLHNINTILYNLTRLYKILFKINEIFLYFFFVLKKKKLDQCCRYLNLIILFIRTLQYGLHIQKFYYTFIT